MADKIKFGLALLLLAAGVAGYYLLSEQVLVLRVLAVLAGLVAATGVAWRTEAGLRVVTLGREAYEETRKVVWPTRKEALQMTGLVFVFVVVMAVFLFLSDKSLEHVLYKWILGWETP
ncbi:MAG: preprotein translocase subunit SecE [Zoogloeaceae bacterium]|nr:preprotein translocase subunit SecE [Zoogloeaceae bacterium]